MGKCVYVCVRSIDYMCIPILQPAKRIKSEKQCTRSTVQKRKYRNAVYTSSALTLREQPCRALTPRVIITYLNKYNTFRKYGVRMQSKRVSTMCVCTRAKSMACSSTMQAQTHQKNEGENNRRKQRSVKITVLLRLSITLEQTASSDSRVESVRCVNGMSQSNSLHLYMFVVMMMYTLVLHLNNTISLIGQFHCLKICR